MGSKKDPQRIEGYFDCVMPPPEGFRYQEGSGRAAVEAPVRKRGRN